MPDEGIDFYDDLGSVDLSTVKFGVAGSGDLFYEEDYCVAVDAFSKALIKAKAIQGVPNLKINLYPDSNDKIAIQQFVTTLISKDYKIKNQP